MAQVAILKRRTSINEITKTINDEIHKIFILDYREKNELKSNSAVKIEEHNYYREFLINVTSDKIEPQLKDIIVFNNHNFKILLVEQVYGKIFKVICGYD